MIILMLKNPTNIYRIDLKNTRRERGYLTLEDLRIKSKFSRSNMPIREVGRSGERENLIGRRKKRKKARAGRLGAGLKHKLGARVAPTSLLCHLHVDLEPKSSASGTLAPRRVSSTPASMAPS